MMYVGIDVSGTALEATGANHGSVTGTLRAAGLPVTVVNPRQVRRFAESVG